ncbi:hypothetical protein ACOME3_009952 [Neoechinorhynchus agilis]
MLRDSGPDIKRRTDLKCMEVDECRLNVSRNEPLMDDVFNDLNSIIQRSVPLTYFLQYLITQTHSSNILYFYLFAGQYARKKADKNELLKWAYELHSTFTAKDAPLSVELPSKLEKKINKLLESCETSKIDEVSLRRIFDDSRCFAFANINQKTLSDFRSYFNNAMLDEDGSRRSILSTSSYAKSCQQTLIESILDLYLDGGNGASVAFGKKSDPTSTKDRRRREYDLAYERSLYLSCVATFIIKYCDLKRCGRYDINSVDHFLHRDKQYIFRSSQASKRKGHLFIQRTFYKITKCNDCHKLLSGTGPQGFACSNCGICLDAYCVMNGDGTDLEECKLATASSKSGNQAAASTNQRRFRGSKFFPQKTTSDSNRRTEQTVKDQQTEFVDSNMSSGDTTTYIGSLPIPDFSLVPSDQYVSASATTAPLVHRSKSDRWPREKPLDKLSKPSSLSTSTIEAILMGRIAGNLEVQTSSEAAHSINRKTSGIIEEVSSIHQICGSTVALIDDSDFDSDRDTVPSVENVLSSNMPQKIPLKELKRRISTIELYHTERSHLRNLKVLKYVFKDRLLGLPCISDQEIDKIFPGIEELIEHHSNFKNSLRKQQMGKGYNEDSYMSSPDPVGDIILDHLGGEKGNSFAYCCSKFLEDQRTALRIIRRKMNRADFYNCLRMIEANPLCRKLSLKDFLPCVMSRIAKYKLLFQQILKYTGDEIERRKLIQCCELADSLNMKVNEAVRQKENLNMIEEIKSNLFIKIPDDGKVIDGLDNGQFVFEQRRLIFSSVLEFQWPLKDIEFQACLFDDCLALFQRIPIPQLKNSHHSSTSLMNTSAQASVTSNLQPAQMSASSSGLYKPSIDDDVSHRYLLQNHYIGHEFGNMDITVCPILKIDQFMLKKKAGLDNCAFFLVGKGKCQFLIELRALNREDCDRLFEHVKKCQSRPVELTECQNQSSSPNPPSITPLVSKDQKSIEVKLPDCKPCKPIHRSTSDMYNYLLNKLSNNNSDEKIVTIDPVKRSCLLHMINVITQHGHLVQDVNKMKTVESVDIPDRLYSHLENMDAAMNRLICSMTELLTNDRIVSKKRLFGSIPLLNNERTCSVMNTSQLKNSLSEDDLKDHPIVDNITINHDQDQE